jgi:hypothetical protein
MKQFIVLLLAAASFAILAPTSASAQASDDASHDVSIIVQEINAIEVGGNVDIVLDAAAPGEAPTPKTAASTYAMTTNSSAARKITAVLSAEYAGNIQLSVELDAPSTGQSVGQQVLNASEAKDLVTDIAPTSETDLGITYTAEASATDAPGTYTQTVTYTILAQ